MPAMKKSTRGWRQAPKAKATTNAKVASLTRQIKRIKKSQELKWFDVNLTGASGGLVEPLNNVPLGDDATARDGRKIMMTACIAKGSVGITGGTSAFPRYAIVYDMAPNGVLPAATDIFTASTAVAQVNLNNQNRFKILWDNHGGLKLGRDPFQFNASVNETGTFVWNDYIKIKDLITHFKDTGSGTIGGTLTGALYAVFLGSGATTAASISFRIRYFDS